MLNLIISLAVLMSSVSFDDDSYRKQREKMVAAQIESQGISDKATLKAMASVKRHLFVRKDLIRSAYDDRPLPIGYGQTISQPYIVAYMTEIIHPKKDYRVLEIGTGSGYQAAVLAKIVEQVYTIEIIPKLGESAKDRLKRLDYTNVEAKIADGYYGWKEHAPFDAIVVTAACEYVPPPLIEQLKDGGKMVIPIGSPFLVQTLMLVEKIGSKIKTTNLMPVRFVPFRRTN